MGKIILPVISCVTLNFYGKTPVAKWTQLVVINIRHHTYSIAFIGNFKGKTHIPNYYF